MKDIDLILNFLQRNLIPPKLVHWKTPLLISIVLWCLSVGATTELARNILAKLSLLFLTVALGWVTTKKPFLIGKIPMGYWVIGACTCFLLYENSWKLVMIGWPLASACVIFLFNFFQSGEDLKPSWREVRQTFVIVVLIHIMISCWFAFHWVIQGWLQSYPSLLSDSFNSSVFVVKFQSQPFNNSRGIMIISLMEQNLKAKTSAKPWAEVEQWLWNQDLVRLKLQKEVLAKLPPLPENSWWSLETKMQQGESNYVIELKAIWQGPTSTRKGYELKKSCQINRSGTLSEVVCGQLLQSPL